VFPRLIFALIRAILIALLVVTPSLLLPSTDEDTAQIVVVLAILASILTFAEYFSKYPSIIEFRFAPPMNRLRFLGLGLTVLFLSLIARGHTDPSNLTNTLTLIGDGIGTLIDFPYSPVHQVVLMMPPDADAELIDSVRIAAGISYMVSIVVMFIFITMVRIFGWPLRKGSFNVWLNLPLFDPTGGGDVLFRLKRDAGLNIVLGALLPFLIPAAVNMVSEVITPVSLANPQTLIWTMSAWAFLPASMLMRGIAMERIADLIEQKRARDAPEGALNA
jgi:hypothetical protein